MLKERKEAVDSQPEKSRGDLNSRVCSLEARVDRMQENWLKFYRKFVASAAFVGLKFGQMGAARLALVAAICISGLTAAILWGSQAKETGDKDHWDVAGIRSNGDFDTDGGVVAAGNITSSAGNITSSAGNIDATTGTVTDDSDADGNRLMRVYRSTYTYATDGGAVGTVALGETIPDNFIVTEVMVDVSVAALPTTNDATVAIQWMAADDFVAAILVTNATTFAATGVRAGVPTGTAAASIKGVSNSPLRIVIGTSAITGGTWTVFAKGFQGD